MFCKVDSRDRDVDFSASCPNRHDCCPLDGGVTCSDLAHCCPWSAPNCDSQRGMCVSDDGKVSVPWTAKTKASVADKPEAKAAEAASLPLGMKRAGDFLQVHKDGERMEDQ